MDLYRKIKTFLKISKYDNYEFQYNNFNKMIVKYHKIPNLRIVKSIINTHLVKNIEKL